MPSSAGYYPPGQQQQQQQQQQSVIQKWALVRPDTLQDLLARQRGTSSVHHGGGTNQEGKDCHHLPIIAANGEKTATTGPPSGTRLDSSPEQPQGISHAHALWHQSRASCRGHSGRLPALEHSLALYQPCLQQVLSLTRVEGCGEHRGCRLKVLRLIPTRALALPRQLTDTGSVRWRHGTLKLMGGPTWVPGSESLHLPGCPVWIPRIYLMAIYCPSEET